jgi:hypothetical protein
MSRRKRPASWLGAAATSPSAREWAARLPFDVELGPYRLGVEWRERAHLLDRRRRACIDLESARIELRNDLAGLALAKSFFGCLIRLAHYSKGCQQGCVEEAYTHSFATGLVEFAQRNPRAWLWFNLLLAEHLPGRPRFDQSVRGVLVPPPRLPGSIDIAGRTVALRCISRSETGNAFGWYDPQRREVQLYVGLSGANLPVVALHEITHAVHHAYALKVRDSHGNYNRAQLEGWLGVMRNNPMAWHWLIWAMSLPQGAKLAHR